MFLSLLVLSSAALANSASVRIVGGSNVDVSEVPYQLSLELFGAQICGASILSSSLALTSALCLQGVDSTFLTVRQNSTMRGVGGEIFPVKKHLIHPSFDKTTFDYDIGLVYLETGSLNENAAVKLPRTKTYDNSHLQVTGWGRLQTNGHMANHLQKVEVDLVSHEICEKMYYDRITDNMMCAVSKGKDACQGDDGNALVAKVDNGFLQVGIVSWGYGCAEPGYAGVYTDLSKFYDWINANLNLY